MKQFTDITVLLDRSGSMFSIKGPMETAFNKFVEEHKANSTTKLTLIEFDSLDPMYVVYQCVPIGAVEPLRLNPRGGTPLLDAMCRTIDTTGKRLAALDESERPDQVLMVIITDGQENDSRTFKRTDVSSRVTKQSDTYKWQFVYLGANQDAIKEAESFGIPMNWALNYQPTAASTTSALNALVTNTVSYSNAQGNLRSKSVPSFTATQRTLAEEK